MIFTEDEKEYHMDLIRDTIDYCEQRKPATDFPLEEHIDLIISYNEHFEFGETTLSAANSENYQALVDKSYKDMVYLIEVYREHGQLDITRYYPFCKTIHQMMTILNDEINEINCELAIDDMVATEMREDDEVDDISYMLETMGM